MSVSAATDSHSSSKVLVADDQPELRNLVVKCVRSLGCSVFEARDGTEAWELAQQIEFDLVILDVMMPGMSGWEVCRRLKTSGKKTGRPAPKVLMLTGIGPSLNEITSPLFAADDWIDKPFTFAQLLAQIKKLIAPDGKGNKRQKDANPRVDMSQKKNAARRNNKPKKDALPSKSPSKSPKTRGH